MSAVEWSYERVYTLRVFVELVDGTSHLHRVSSVRYDPDGIVCFYDNEVVLDVTYDNISSIIWN